MRALNAGAFRVKFTLVFLSLFSGSPIESLEFRPPARVRHASKKNRADDRAPSLVKFHFVNNHATLACRFYSASQFYFRLTAKHTYRIYASSGEKKGKRAKGKTTAIACTIDITLCLVASISPFMFLHVSGPLPIENRYKTDRKSCRNEFCYTCQI